MERERARKRYGYEWALMLWLQYWWRDNQRSREINSYDELWLCFDFLDINLALSRLFITKQLALGSVVFVVVTIGVLVLLNLAQKRCCFYHNFYAWFAHALISNANECQNLSLSLYFSLSRRKPHLTFSLVVSIQAYNGSCSFQF